MIVVMTTWAAVGASTTTKQGQEHKHHNVTSLHTQTAIPSILFSFKLDVAIEQIAVVWVTGSFTVSQCVHSFAIAHVALDEVILVTQRVFSAGLVVTGQRSHQQHQQAQQLPEERHHKLTLQFSSTEKSKTNTSHFSTFLHNTTTTIHYSTGAISLSLRCSLWL